MDRTQEGTSVGSGTPPMFTRVQVSAVLVMSAICSLVGALQPLLLGPMAAAGRLTTQEIGRSAMLEALGMAVAVAVAGTLLRPNRLRLVIAVSSLVSLAANLVSIQASHEAIMAARLVNGLSVGVMLWIWTGLLTHVALPARLVAIFMTLQAVSVLALSSLLSTAVTPRWGASGGYGCLAVISVITLLLAIPAPAAYRPAPHEARSAVRYPDRRGIVALLGIVMHMAGIMAVWVYAMPIGRQQGLDEAFVSRAISVALAAQIFGGLAGTVMAAYRPRVALLVSLGASFVALGGVGLASGSGPAFIAGLAVIAFFFMFAPGFHMPFLIEVDPSRRAAIFMISAQLLGFSAGPALVSLVVTGQDVSAALAVSAALFVGAGLVIAGLTTLWRGSPGIAPSVAAIS